MHSVLLDSLSICDRSSCEDQDKMTASTQQCQHCEAMNLLLKSAKYSDLTLVCEGKEFYVHRAVLCPKPTFFDAA
ncbi:hypothetical protein Egran_06824, partial [Elaphomyces granulatus]